MKKGFTLIELLAVIIVLAIVALIATPIVLDVIEDSKKSAAESEANLILSGINSYCNNEDFKIEAGTLKEEDRLCDEDLKDNIDEIVPNKSSNTEIKNVKYENGKVTYIMVQNSGTQFELNKDGLLINTTDGYLGANPCTFDGELVQGAEYVNGQYTYRYMQEFNYRTTWQNIEEDGWGVTLTDKSSTDAVTTQLCSSINGKPIVSMSYMFAGAQTTSVDLSSFDTSNVIDMQAMFYNRQLSSINVSNFDTSKVTNMYSMFAYEALEEFEYGEREIIGLENFDTSNVTTMQGMFDHVFISSLNLSSFDTKNVTNMYYMFAYSTIEELDLSSFDIPSDEDLFWNTVAYKVYVKDQNMANIVISARDAFELMGGEVIIKQS